MYILHVIHVVLSDGLVLYYNLDTDNVTILKIIRYLVYMIKRDSIFELIPCYEI